MAARRGRHVVAVVALTYVMRVFPVVRRSVGGLHHWWVGGATELFVAQRKNDF